MLKRFLFHVFFSKISHIVFFRKEKKSRLCEDARFKLIKSCFEEVNPVGKSRTFLLDATHISDSREYKKSSIVCSMLRIKANARSRPYATVDSISNKSFILTHDAKVAK